MDQDTASLSISDLARLTGLQVSQLRAWDARHGFPRARRLENGHRRYSPADVDLVGRVVEYRDAGVSLAVAIERASAASDGPVESVFAELRRSRPDLPVHRMSRRTMLAISRAIEDECAAAGDRATIVGAFETDGAYRRVGTRWRELARTAATAVVFADFAAAAPGPPVEVPLPAAAVLRREWIVACESPRFCAVLAGWELPLGRGRAGFEAMWSVERGVVAAAIDVGLSLARRLAPATSWPVGQRVVEPEDASAVARRATHVTNRVVANLDGGG